MSFDQSILDKAQEYIRVEESDSFREEVKRLIEGESWDDLKDRFYMELGFGTGGMRGIIGGGYNRINPYNIRKATQGLASYVKSQTKKENPSAIIAYDSRHYSNVFSLEAARVLCGNGIKTYLFRNLRPTPELSFGVRLLGTDVGIVITASHNPPAYNGYKVYWNDGGQVVSPHDQGIIGKVRAVKRIVSMSEEEAVREGLLLLVDREIDEPYHAMVKRQVLRPELVREKGKELKVVYTPLHGTGAVPIATVLGEMGIEVTFVPEQRQPDGSFPTVEYPNPEESSAMKMAVDLGTKIRADLVMGTDPDADRLGIAVPSKDGFTLITGNQLGVLLADYIFSTRKEMGSLPDNPAFIKTIVTTDLGRLIAEQCGAKCFDTLTGFKYIAAKIREFESTENGPVYVFGGEESYGYLIGSEVRDKDAVSAAVLTAEMTLYHLSKKRSLMDRLNELYGIFGYFQEAQLSRTFKGEQGFKAMCSLMDRLRSDPPLTWGGRRTEIIRDMQEGTNRYVSENRTEETIELPQSNVLQFVLVDDSIITVRPSGTEPKIKFYASCRSERGVDLETARVEVGDKIEKITREIQSLL